MFVRYFWLSTFGAVNSSTILAVYVVDAVESDDFWYGKKQISLHEAKSKQACTRQACSMKIGAIAMSARSDALVAMFA